MDIAELADEIGPLRYEAEYRFLFGQVSHQTLSVADLRSIFHALEDRGYTVLPQVESPLIA